VIFILAVIGLELSTKRSRNASVSRIHAKTVEKVHEEKKLVKQELPKQSTKKSNKLWVSVLIFGALVLLLSVVFTSTVVALIGLSLVFWGFLFFFARPTQYVRSSVLDATAASVYTMIDRILDDLNYDGKPVCIPSYPTDVYLPEHLKGLKEMVLFVSAKDSVTMPAIEDIIGKRFFVKNPEGVCITPPGSELVKMFEKELGSEFTNVDQLSFYEDLPQIIVDTLELASDFEINSEKDLVHVKITDSVYGSLYSPQKNLKCINSVGCPLASAVSCVLAKTTGKLVVLDKIETSLNLKNVDVWMKIVEG
jgi:hypothetical protein